MSQWVSKIRSVFPPPRTVVSWKTTLPLILFLILAIALFFGLEESHVLLFTRWWPLLFLALAPWIWWMHLGGFSGLMRFRASIALWARFMLLALMIALLCEPRAVRSDERLSVMYVIDASASVGESRDRAVKYVLKVAENKPHEDEAGLMFFGRGAAVELPPGPSLPVGQGADRAMNVRIDKDATNIATALSTAAAVLPADRAGRIVLISDGVATTGELNGVLNDLKSRDIAVDVLPISYELDKEVWIERLELPRFVKIGETYEAAVLLEALSKGEGRLIVRENDAVIYDEKVEYAAGKNRFTVPVYLQTAGYFEYSAKIETADDEDHWSNNNTAISYLYLKGKGKVMLLVDPQADERDWAAMVEAMKQSEREVDLVDVYEAPSDPLAYLPYDTIVLANVARDLFTELQMQAMHDAVRHQGSGLLMVGGENSFGPGAWARTPIEDALPVEMDITQRKVMPKGALAIILHTCEFPQGNTWAKRITKQAIKVLSAQDEVGILAFDWNGGDRWIQKLTPAGNYEAIARTVEAAQIGDMPDYAGTMKMGLDALVASDASAKHMIIISDGDASPPSAALLQQFVANKVSVSTVSVFPHGNVEIKLMGSIAKATGGRYYPSPKDPKQLPAIFIKEAKTLRRTAIQNRVFTPEVESVSPILKGIEAMPKLEGLVLTTPKPRANIVLRAPTAEKDKELDPILATWRYGVGASAAFTSDLSTNWGKHWVSWGQYRAFIRQLLTNISRASSESNLRMRSFSSGEQGVVIVEDFAETPALLTLKAQVQGPHGLSKSIELNQTGPRRYEARFPIDGEGRYQVMAVGASDDEGDVPQRVHGGFVVPYSAEYLRFRANPILLRQIADRTGGNELTGDETSEAIYGGERDPRRTSRPIIDWLLILIACLIPLDVGLRRVQVDLTVVTGLFRKKEATTDDRMSALLKRKQQVKDRMKTTERKPTAPTPARENESLDAPPVLPNLPRSKPKPKAEDKPAADAPSTMTSRLLDAKRRAREQMEDDTKD